MPLTFEAGPLPEVHLPPKIFPGGRLPSIEMVGMDRSSKGGFTLTRRQSLQPQYAQTLDHWSAALEAHKDPRPSRSSPKRSTTATCII